LDFRMTASFFAKYSSVPDITQREVDTVKPVELQNISAILILHTL
jgi:hypothetical protein